MADHFGFSKSYGLAGMRLGLLATPDPTQRQRIMALAHAEDTAYGASTISQAAGAAAYELGDEWLERFVAHLRRRRDQTVAQLAAILGVRCAVPEGTFVAFLDVSRLGVDSEELAGLLLEHHDVAVVPGSRAFFGPGATGHLRLSFATSRGILAEGLDRMHLSLPTLRSPLNPTHSDHVDHAPIQTVPDQLKAAACAARPAGAGAGRGRPWVCNSPADPSRYGWLKRSPTVTRDHRRGITDELAPLIRSCVAEMAEAGWRLDDELEVTLMTATPAAPRGAATNGVSGPGVGGLSVTKFLDPLPIPRVITVPPLRELWELQITMRTECVRLHSQLPPTTVWTYNGSFPGPTIRLRRGQKLRVNWQNEITGNFPVTSVQVQGATPFQTPGPGRNGVEPREDVAALPPWTVVHLHGAQTGGGNDGWTENAVLPGNSQLAEYPNDQQATTLWYHDHAMAITALNVMSGLMGMYLISDAEEDALELPHGKHEVPLIITDRNFDTDANGNLTGELLHKVNILQTTPEQIVLPFLGPFTLVNGVIWPHLEVDARWVRFRVLNASNSRFYQFELRDEDGAPISGALRQIGTDGGLLPAPVALDQLTLAPAERADILINFGAFRGKRLTLVNTLAPPFEPGTTTPNLDVMQFRVRARPVHDPFTLPSTLSPSFVRLTHDTLPEHGHRWLVLTLLDDRHPEMWEMVEIDDPPASLPVDGIVQVRLADGTLTTLQRVGRTFKDAANFYIAQESWEQWKILNVSPVAHPIHLHLVQFQALGRELFDVAGFDTAVGGTTTPVAYTGEGTLDPNEQGWKDTIRVNGSRVVDGELVGELVSIIGQFGGASGRFMYHCHILEHEDEGMMSTFVVMPAEVMAVDPHTGGGHHPNPRQTTLWDAHSRFVGPRGDVSPGPHG